MTRLLLVVVVENEDEAVETMRRECKLGMLLADTFTFASLFCLRVARRKPPLQLPGIRACILRAGIRQKQDVQWPSG